VNPPSRALLLSLLALSAAVGALLAVPAQASEALAQRHACTACHQAERKLVGPSWRDVSHRYADSSITPAQLADSMRAGGSGKWAAVPMPPQPQVPESDLLALSRWILQVRTQ
jgi:cytochrome c